MTEKRPATASRGMVVSNHPLGSAAGAEMFAAGGNAADAAIAALFALTVVEPMMVGIFGAGMTHVRLADGRHLVIDNYTTAPAAARDDMYVPVSDTCPDYLRVQGDFNVIGLPRRARPGRRRPVPRPWPASAASTSNRDAARDPPRRARLPRHAVPGAGGAEDARPTWRAFPRPPAPSCPAARPSTRVI